MKIFRISSFTLISGVGWCMDFSLFNYLVSVDYPYLVSNLVSALVAVAFVFLFSRKWVFRNHVGSLKAATLQYIVWSIVAIAVASQLLSVIASILEHRNLSFVTELIAQISGKHLDQRSLVSNMAKILITPFTMYANFVAVGYIIERRLCLV